MIREKEKRDEKYIPSLRQRRKGKRSMGMDAQCPVCTLGSMPEKGRSQIDHTHSRGRSQSREENRERGGVKDRLSHETETE